jgi:hypothetical protein
MSQRTITNITGQTAATKTNWKAAAEGVRQRVPRLNFHELRAPLLSANRREAAQGQSVEPARYHAPSHVSELQNEQLVPGCYGPYS